MFGNSLPGNPTRAGTFFPTTDLRPRQPVELPAGLMARGLPAPTQGERRMDRAGKNRWVSFRILDVYIPDPMKMLMNLHGRDILQGKVIDLSDNGTEAFIVVEVNGMDQPVIVPAGRILECRLEE
jgi:hypothetical protein